jgi:hypothetical protein
MVEIKLNGKLMNYDNVVSYMDDDIREELHSKLAPCEPQEFINAYVEKHYEKFGEQFYGLF